MRNNRSFTVFWVSIAIFVEFAFLWARSMFEIPAWILTLGMIASGVVALLAAFEGLRNLLASLALTLMGLKVNWPMVFVSIFAAVLFGTMVTVAIKQSEIVDEVHIVIKGTQPVCTIENCDRLEWAPEFCKANADNSIFATQSFRGCLQSMNLDWVRCDEGSDGCCVFDS